jgi:hypothetical protein
MPIDHDDDAVARSYPTRRTRRGEDQEPEDDDHGQVRSYVIPGLLGAIGIGILLTQVTWTPPEIPKRIMIGPGEMFAIAVFGVAVAIAAVMLAAKLLDYQLGTINIAVIKIAGVSLLATSLALPMIKLDKTSFDLSGFSLGWSFMLGTYWIFIPILFKLEIQETMLTVFLIAVGTALAMGGLVSMVVSA